jgi:nucleolar protein 56
MGLTTYNFQDIRTKLLAESKERIATSIGPDFLISQAVHTLGELDKTNNMLAVRLREWYELYNPEISKKVRDHQRFVEIALEAAQETEMGGKFSKEDVEAMLHYAQKIKGQYEEKEYLIKYIEARMKILCPHVLEVAGAIVGSKLLAHKGTLRAMAFMPSSTIQLLGAEKALFRHLRSNANPPKYGYVLQHPLVAQAKNKGQAARQLANKISLAAKQDYFAEKEADK